MKKINWNEIKEEFPLGSIVIGKVEHHMPFGAFIDLDNEFVRGIIQITDFIDEGVMTPSLYPPLKTNIKCKVIGYTEDERNQIWLSVKPSDLLHLSQNDSIL